MTGDASVEPELEPPWSAYPMLEYGSLGWRMGCGEDHMHRWFAYVRAHIRGLQSALAYLQRHPRAPRTWSMFLLSWLQPLAKSNPRGALAFDRGQVAALGLTDDDVGYRTHIRNIERAGGMKAPWTWRVFGDSPAGIWRHLTREIGWWARWLANDCADRDAWLEAQPAPPAAWAPVVAAVRARHTDASWSTVTGGAVRLIPLTVAFGALPPPWLGGRGPRNTFEYDDARADDIERWMWWLWATFDDAASWRSYLARWPPPPRWQAVLARRPYDELDRALRS